MSVHVCCVIPTVDCTVNAWILWQDLRGQLDALLREKDTVTADLIAAVRHVVLLLLSRMCMIVDWGVTVQRASAANAEVCCADMYW